MNEYLPILQNIPFFRHCTAKELEHLISHLRLSRIKKNQTVDLKKNNSINIVLDGIFQVEIYGKKDYIYLAPSSFFGDFPFAKMKNRGIVRAISSATLAHLNTDDLYYYFLRNYRCLRGYIKCLELLGFEIIEPGKELFSKRSKIITIFSLKDKAGKSTMAISFASALSQYGKSMVLDMSYGGQSIFEIVGKNVPLPISQKEASIKSQSSMIHSRKEHITKNVDMLNVVHGSAVRPELAIISPLLIMLSKFYEYIVIDLSNEDIELRNYVFEQSDYIIPIITNNDDLYEFYTIFDSLLTDCQQVHYIINEYKTKNFHRDGIFTFKRIENITHFDEEAFISSVPSQIVDTIRKPCKALIFTTNSPDALHYGWFLSMLKEHNPFTLFAASDFALIPFLCFLIANTKNDFQNLFKKIIEVYLPKIFEIHFPKEILFGNNNARKIARMLFKDLRMEYFLERGLFFFASNDGSKKIFSTGNLADMFVLAFSHYPLFPEFPIGNAKYRGSFIQPYYCYETLLRMDIEQIYSIRIKGNDDFIGTKKILPWYAKYQKYFATVNTLPTILFKSSNDYVINIKDLNSLQKIESEIEKQANKFLQENNLI